MDSGTWLRLPDARRFWVFVAFLGLFFIGLGVFFAVLTGTDNSAASPPVVGVLIGLAFGLVGMMPLAIGLRGIRAGVAIGSGGIVVRNTFRTHCLALEDVVCFEAAPSPGSDPHIPAQGLVRLRDGRTIRLSAFVDNGIALQGPARRRYSDVAGQMTAMNGRLAALRDR